VSSRDWAIVAGALFLLAAGFWLLVFAALRLLVG